MCCRMLPDYVVYSDSIGQYSTGENLSAASGYLHNTFLFQYILSRATVESHIPTFEDFFCVTVSYSLLYSYLNSVFYEEHSVNTPVIAGYAALPPVNMRMYEHRNSAVSCPYPSGY